MERQNSDRKAHIIAAAVTAVAVLLFVLACVLVRFSPQAPDLPDRATPQLLAADDVSDDWQEEFIEPPVVVDDAGEPQPSEVQDDTPAPAPLGEPDKADVKSDKVSTNGPETKPNNSASKLVTQKKNSPVKHTNPSKKEQPDSRIASEVGQKFPPHNGKSNGKQTDSNGSSTVGSGNGSAVGKLDGKRRMLSCNDKFPVKLTKQITVIVEVTVNDKGRVIKATCKTHVAESIRKKVVEESLKSTWTPKAGAVPAIGTITWTLRPKVK